MAISYFSGNLATKWRTVSSYFFNIRNGKKAVKVLIWILPSKKHQEQAFHFYHYLVGKVTDQTLWGIRSAIRYNR